MSDPMTPTRDPAIAAADVTRYARALAASLRTGSSATMAEYPELPAELDALCDEVDRLRRELAARDAAQWTTEVPTHRHYRGGLYRELRRATLEGADIPVVVYQAHPGGRVWVRPASEFDGYVDGKRRFMPIPAPPAPATGEAK